MATVVLKAVVAAGVVVVPSMWQLAAPPMIVVTTPINWVIKMGPPLMRNNSSLPFSTAPSDFSMQRGIRSNNPISSTTPFNVATMLHLHHRDEQAPGPAIGIVPGQVQGVAAPDI